MITETQTALYDIRDAFFNLVSADPFFAGFTCRKNQAQPVQANLLPYLGVYVVDEIMAPDGDANAGCIRFIHTGRIGFSVIQANSDSDLCEQAADQAMLAIMRVAYTDLHLNNVLHNNNPEGVGIEAITRGTRRQIYGAPSTDNETPFIELRYEASVSFRTEWYPDITDTLNEIDVTTRVNNDPDITPITTVYYLNAAMLRQTKPPLRRPWQYARDQNRRQ